MPEHYTYLTISKSLNIEVFDFLEKWNHFCSNIYHKKFSKNANHPVYYYIQNEPILYLLIEKHILTPLHIKHMNEKNYRLEIFDAFILSTLQTFLQFFHQNGILRKVFDFQKIENYDCNGIIAIYPIELDYFLIHENHLHIAFMNESGYFCEKENLLKPWLNLYQEKINFILYKNQLNFLLN